MWEALDRSVIRHPERAAKIQPGGEWWTHVEIEKARRANDKERLKDLENTLDKINAASDAEAAMRSAWYRRLGYLQSV